jgi:hypothetical protein
MSRYYIRQLGREKAIRERPKAIRKRPGAHLLELVVIAKLGADADHGWNQAKVESGEGKQIREVATAVTTSNQCWVMGGLIVTVWVTQFLMTCDR